MNADVVAILIGKYTSLVTMYKSADIGLRLFAHQYYLPRFVIYDRISHMESVKKPTRSQKNLSKEQNNIPPIQEAFLQHTKHIVYQAGIWTTCYQAQQHTPTSEGCGWTLDGETITCSKLPMTAKACIELVDCCFKSFGVAVLGVHARKPNWDAPNFLLVNTKNSCSDAIQYRSVLCLLVDFDTWQT